MGKMGLVCVILGCFVCWLKKQKDPLAPDWQEAGDNTIWTSGLVFGKSEAIVKMETKYGTLHIKVSGTLKPMQILHIMCMTLTLTFEVKVGTSQFSNSQLYCEFRSNGDAYEL
ncbi:hypothetical protein HanRHA438_Chr06g0251441 [Helianthus annuus]|nr:hypothetical protein HanRHA438_Chr06g0251441 [Helianthus annuus]